MRAHRIHDAAIGPVRPIDYGNSRAWLVTRFNEARKALADPRMSKNLSELAGSAKSARMPVEIREAMGSHMLNADPPEHTRLRRPVARAITAHRIRSLRPRVEHIAMDLLEEMRPSGQADLLTEFAYPLPIKVLCELVGLPMRDRERFRAWSETIVSQSAAQHELLEAASALHAYLQDLIRRKRRHPADDLLSDLLGVEEPDERLSDAEIISTLFLLIVAGFETTTNLIGNGTLLLLLHPAAFDRIRQHPHLVSAAVEEFLRYRGPVETAMRRYTLEPVTLGNVTIPAREIVLVSLAAANHDPEQFTRPTDFDITRSPNAHVAFGHGPHFCLGAPLARLEGNVAFTLLIERLPGLRLSVDPRSLAWKPGMMLRGLTRLPVRWDMP
jgi:cytochrome P450